MGPNWVALVSLKERKRHQHSLTPSLSLYTCPDKRPCEDTAIWQPSTTQEERARQTPTLLAPCYWPLAPRTVRKEQLLFKPPRLCCLLMVPRTEKYMV